MNATKIVIVASLVAILIAAAILLGRWAADQSRATEARYSQAMTVLLDR